MARRRAGSGARARRPRGEDTRRSVRARESPSRLLEGDERLATTASTRARRRDERRRRLRGIPRVHSRARDRERQNERIAGVLSNPTPLRRARLTCAPSRLCANRRCARDDSRGDPSQTVFAPPPRAVGRGAGSARGGARPRRRRRGRGPVRGRRRGRERGGRTKVRGEASRDTPSPARKRRALNVLNSFHAAGAGASSRRRRGPRSVAASRFTAMTHVIAARHAHITAVVSSAEAVAASALAAAARVGGRGGGGAATRARAKRALGESQRVRDARRRRARAVFSPRILHL